MKLFKILCEVSELKMDVEKAERKINKLFSKPDKDAMHEKHFIELVQRFTDATNTSCVVAEQDKQMILEQCELKLNQ